MVLKELRTGPTCGVRVEGSASRGGRGQHWHPASNGALHSGCAIITWCVQGEVPSKELKTDVRGRGAHDISGSREGGQGRREAQEHSNGGGPNSELGSRQAVKKPRLRSRVVAAE